MMIVLLWKVIMLIDGVEFCKKMGMGIYGCLGVYGYVWVSMGRYEFLYWLLWVYDYLWVFMRVYGFQ